MKKQLIILIFVSILIFFSCNKNEQRNINIVSFTEFPVTEEIENQIITFRNVQASDLFSVEDILIVKQGWVDRGVYIKYFDKNTLKFLGQTGKHGRGPGEIVNPDFPAVDIKNKKVYLIDQGRNRDVFEFDIEKSIKDIDYIPEKLFEVGNERLFV